MGRIFGAYTDIPWSSEKGYKNGNGDTFVFSLRDDFNFVKLECFHNSREVYHGEEYLTSIGSGADAFRILDNCNTNIKSVSYLSRYE